MNEILHRSFLLHKYSHVDKHTELSKVAKEIALILLGISVAGAVFLALLHWMVTL